MRTIQRATLALGATMLLAQAGCAQNPAGPAQGGEVVATAAAASAASAPAAPPTVTTESAGEARLPRPEAGTVSVVFADSPTLTQRLSELLARRGYTVAPEGQGAYTLLVEGTVVMSGGPDYHRGLKISLGELSERGVSQPGPDNSVRVGDVTGGAVSVGVANAILQSGGSAFFAGLNLGSFAKLVGDATGVRGWFNRKVSGDPRGFCLSRCEDWNKVRQAVYLRAELKRGEEMQSARVAARAFGEALVVEQMVGEAFEGLMAELMRGAS